MKCLSGLAMDKVTTLGESTGINNIIKASAVTVAKSQG